MSSSSSGGGFEESKFMKDLIHLRDTQEAIQGFSAWCIKHRKAAYKIARCWLKIVKKVRVDQKLTLFYLLNDIVQHCRRKNYSEFLTRFESVLKEAMPHLKDDKINVKLLRCIHIWSERNVFSESFLEEIKSIIIDDKDAEEIDNFQPTQLCTQIKIMKALEDDTDYKLKTLKDSEINIMDIDSLRQTLKDRQDGNDFISDFEKSTAKMQDYVKAIDKELGKRRKVIELLTNGGKYYESLLGEANIVANAYTNFEKRVMNLKRKLGEKIPELERNPPVSDNLSPIPSPDYDAPSPVNDEYELKLPGEESNNNSDPTSSKTSETTNDGKKSSSNNNVSNSNSSTSNGSRDLNQRLHSMMSSSSELSCSSTSGSSNDKNFSISEFLTRLAEGKPVGGKSAAGSSSSMNGTGYIPSVSSEKAPPNPSSSLPLQNQTTSSQISHQSSMSVPPPMPVVQHPHAMRLQTHHPMPVPTPSDQGSGVANEWWNNPPPPPPPPPLPVPTPIEHSEEPWNEPVPEWKLPAAEDETIKPEKDLMVAAAAPQYNNNREPILSTSYPPHLSSENSKNNLINLVCGSSRREVDMDVVDSDHDEHDASASGGSQQGLSLQDRLKNLAAGIPAATTPSPEKNDYRRTSPSFFVPSPQLGHQNQNQHWDSNKKIRSNHFNNFHNRGNRGSPYHRGGRGGFHLNYEREHGNFERGRGHHHQRGFRRW